MNNENIIASGRIPDPTDAVRDPHDYTVSYNPGLGWSLSFIDGDFSRLITRAEAEAIIEAGEAL